MSTEGAVDHDWEHQVAQGLQLVVQHCPALDTPQDLCSLLRVSTTIRRAVRQSRGHCSLKAPTSRVLGHERDPCLLGRVVGMAAWLTNNCSLVSDLHLMLRGNPQAHAAQQAVTLSLRLCAGMATTTAAAAPQQPGQLDGTSSCPPPLRLTSFHTDRLYKPDVLQLLPRFGVEVLDLEQVVSLRAEVISAPVCAALAQITTLQQLYLPLNGPAVPQGLGKALDKLQGLSFLRCSISPDDLQLLPASLQHLEVRIEAAADAAATFSCSHLAALLDLRIWRQRVEPLRIVLPPKVQQVEVQGAVCLQGLREVQELELTQSAGTLETLQRLSWVTSPFSLNLSLVPEQQAGPGQAQLPNPAGRQEHAKALSLLTAVTRLGIWDAGIATAGPEASWCAAVLPLHNLRDLYLDLVALPSSELVQLSTLTALTTLDLRMDSGLDDATAVAILQKLTNLQDLSLQGSLPSWDVLPVLAQLTNLRALRLICKRGLLLSPAGLQQLSTLTQLESLIVPLAADCTTSAVRQFLAGMPQLDSIV